MKQPDVRKNRDSFDRLLSIEEGKKRIRFKYLIHDCCIVISEFFGGPRKETSELNLLNKAQILLEYPQDEETIPLIEKLLLIHRIHENTKSRRRLEKWATITISIYLLCIAIAFILSSIYRCGSPLIKCDNNVMIALLTTTTINILGLVVIVLKGYFPQEKDEKKSSDRQY